MSIHAKRTLAGLTVRLELNDTLAQTLGLLADAFDDDPELIAGLLVDLAAARRHRDDVMDGAERRNTPDCDINHASSRVDKFVGLLADQLGEDIAVELNRGEALRLAGELGQAAGIPLPQQMRRAS